MRLIGYVRSANLEIQIENGCQLLTMGECATLNHDEHQSAIEITLDEARKSNVKFFLNIFIYIIR